MPGQARPMRDGTARGCCYGQQTNYITLMAMLLSLGLLTYESMGWDSTGSGLTEIRLVERTNRISEHNVTKEPVQRTASDLVPDEKSAKEADQRVRDLPGVIVAPRTRKLPDTFDDGSITFKFNYDFGPNGQLRVPPDKNIWIDIGMNQMNNLMNDGQKTTGELQKTPNAFLIGFEPIFEQYAVLLARHAKLDKQVRPGYAHERAMVFPYAVGRKRGMAEFHVSKIDGCSSLKQQASDAELKNSSWDDWVSDGCSSKGSQKRRVPVVTLQRILDVWLNGREVEYVKADVQGAELDVLIGAGDSLKNVKRIMLEVSNPAKHCMKITNDGATCVELQSYLSTRGFRLVSHGGLGSHFPTKAIDLADQSPEEACKSVPWVECEGDLTWVRTARPTPAPTLNRDNNVTL